VAALLLLLPAAAAHAGGADAEARLAAADALLGDRARWDEAVAVYRALAAEDPEWAKPRQQLARVLAWRAEYPESLALYAELLARSEPPPEAAIERAEVLSWAGRTDEARGAFEAVLATRPGDARAARGMARVHRWSGARAHADLWYARALEAEEDAEARREWEGLRAELRRSLGASGRGYHDSDGFSLWRSGAQVGLDLDFDTRLRFESATLRASQDHDRDSMLAGLGYDDQAVEARAALERRLGPRLEGTLELGARRWSRGGTRPLARAALAFTPDEGTAASLELRHDDLFERTFSLASALRGIGDTTVHASLWRALAPGFEGYAAVDGSLLTDGNGRGGLGASVAWRPIGEREVWLGLGADVQGYGRDSRSYYSPDVDASTTLSLRARLPLGAGFAFHADLGGGAGYASEGGETGFGPSYRAKLGLAFARGGLTVSLDAARSGSQRASLYTAHDVQLAVGWAF
jgi:tetratricopeptide (TPR) repeat protein